MLGVAALDSLPHHRPHGQPEKSIPVPHLLPSSSGAMRKGGSYSSGGVRSVTCTPDHPCRWEHFIFPGCQAVDEQAECEPQSRATTPPCLTVSSNILESSALRPGVWLAVLELAIWQSGEMLHSHAVHHYALHNSASFASPVASFLILQRPDPHPERANLALLDGGSAQHHTIL